MITAKFVIAGGFAVGKTTFVSTATGSAVLRAEVEMTAPRSGGDDLSATPAKRTTTVGCDFGSFDIGPDLRLFLFGTPGQERFRGLWNTIFRGASGVVVLADTRQLESTFSVLDYVDGHPGIPYIVAVNQWPDERVYTEDDVREALKVEPGVPVVRCNALDRTSVLATVRRLAMHVYHQSMASEVAAPAASLQGSET